MRKIKVLATAIVCVMICVLFVGCFETDDGNNPISGTKVTENAGNDTSSENSKVPTITEQVLFEHEGVKVTAKEYKRDLIFGDGISLLLENSSESDITVSVEELIVNNYMISNLFSNTVAAGKKATETLFFSESDLEAAKIPSVGQIEIVFNVFDSDSFETLYTSEIITVKTSAFSSDSVKQDTGTELLNKDGIRIVGKEITEDPIFGPEIVFFIENNSGSNVIIQVDDLSVNGFMISSLFSATVYNGKMAIDGITLLESDLEENGITSIDEVELKFNIVDSESFNTIFTTDAITFTAG